MAQICGTMWHMMTRESVAQMTDEELRWAHAERTRRARRKGVPASSPQTYAGMPVILDPMMPEGMIFMAKPSQPVPPMILEHQREVPALSHTKCEGCRRERTLREKDGKWLCSGCFNEASRGEYDE